MNELTILGDDVLSGTLHDPERVRSIRSVLAKFGRVHVPSFLSEEVAQSLLGACRTAEWRVALKTDKGVFQIDPRDIGVADVAEKTDLIPGIHAQAKPGWFMFDSVPVSGMAEEGVLPPGVFKSFFERLNSDAMISRLRELTGEDRIVYVDAQATRYRPGHFLTVHTDEAANRLCAYVLNLTPNWPMDWGGLLMFQAADGHVAEAYKPTWNAFNIFKVPQRHAVSVVAPFAREPRYSITGWMLSKKP